MPSITRDYLNQKKLFISGEKKFVEKCEKLLNDWIWWSYVGRPILDEIFAGAKTIEFTIVPNAFMTSEPETHIRDGQINDAYGKGYSNPLGVVGTGEGADVSITLNEALTITDATCRAILSAPCSDVVYTRPEFSIMHELVHANRAVRGKMRTVDMGNRLKNSEEAIAIMITNMLMSEKGASKLRKNYDTSEAIDPPDPAAFVKQPGMESMVRQIAADHSALKLRLNGKDVPVAFNLIYTVFQGKDS
jgi:hypothetical protein